MADKFEDSEKDNLVVLAPDGNIYSIPKDVYTSAEYRIRPEQHAKAIPIWNELEKGVVVAKLHGHGTGVGGFCYLLNLPSLAPQEDIHPPTAIKAMLKKTRVAEVAFIKELVDKAVSTPRATGVAKAAPRKAKPRKAT